MKKPKQTNRSWLQRAALKVAMLCAGSLLVAGQATQAKQESELPGLGVQPDEVFFTGKTYSEELGGVVFKYRNYDPELNRWTAFDPSGFPDGVNNKCYISNPVSYFDALGLFMKSVAWVYCYSGDSDLDSESWDGMLDAFNALKNTMQEKDANENPSPEYLSDHDFFEIFTINSISQIGGISADKIFIVAHGLNVGTSEAPVFLDPPQYVIGGESYTENFIVSHNSSIEIFLGCGHEFYNGGVTTTNAIFYDFGKPTMDYLKE